jgi:hypothetical protein
MADEIRATCAESGTGKLRFHVVKKDSYLGWTPVCGGTVLMSHETFPAHTIAKADRCRKSICQRRFFAADEAHSDGVPPSPGGEQ